MYEITPVTIEEEMKQSYLDYAMSVIVSRALPDVRDGLKPVHRRVLFAMRELGNDYNKPYKKSARIVGDVIGKYHPHGDSAVYETIVRMAQDFSLRYPLVDGQGNFGSIDGDSAAAMRYTEIRLAKIGHFLLEGLDKDTVNFVPNYDETEQIPQVLPAAFPNLLVNGTSGIAVGMATNIPPHNLNEVVDACVALIDNPDLSFEELITILPGPDFPTAGIINGRGEIEQAYRTGRGKIYLRARTHFEEIGNDRQAIVITEIPYQVNKAKMIEKIVELVRDKRLEGITGIRDESDKEGIRVVIELRKGENAEVVLNNLFTNTPMQVTFGINMIALDHGQPKVLSLREILNAFLDHRKEIVTRRSLFELKQAKARAHILEGLNIALNNIDSIISLIKGARSPSLAKEELLKRKWKATSILSLIDNVEVVDNEGYQLTEIQAQAVLDLKLQRLTGLEQDKILSEYRELMDLIREINLDLSDVQRLMAIVRKELIEVKNLFGDRRLTEIIQATSYFTDEDLIPPEMVVVTISHEGYGKIQSLDDYRAQHRGGKGKVATSIKEEDFIEHLVVANTHDTLLCFTNLGKVHWIKVYRLPRGSRISKGRPLVNFLNLEEKEVINTILPVKGFDDEHFVFMATAGGIVKKTALSAFSHPRSNGIVAVNLDPEDFLIGAVITDGQQEIMLFSNAGKAVRFSEDAVRPVGRSARGVKGMQLREKQQVIALTVVRSKQEILIATEEGYGKRTAVEDFSKTNRGGQGVISIQVNQRNGQVIGAHLVNEAGEVMLITDQGTLVRINVTEVSVIGRNTQGVRLINLSNKEKLVAMQKIPYEEDV